MRRRRRATTRRKTGGRPWLLLAVLAIAVFSGATTAFVPSEAFTAVALDRPGHMDVVDQRGGALDLTVSDCVESNTPWWETNTLVVVENRLNTSPSVTVSLQNGSKGDLDAAGQTGDSVSFSLDQAASETVEFEYDGDGLYPDQFDFVVETAGTGVSADATRGSEVRDDCSGAGTPTPTPPPGNEPPVADFTASQSGWFTYDLDGSASYDPDGTVVGYDWDVGNDGDVDATGETATVFAWPNTEVRLIVTDDDGATDSVIMTV